MICATVGAEAQLSKPMAFDTYQVKDGMAGNWVQDLVQDRDGNMWIGTNEGLSKYDGYSFQNYRNNTEDSTTLSSDHVRGLVMDSAGNIWARTQFSLDLYNPTQDNFQRFPYRKFAKNAAYEGFINRSKSFFCASDGTLYAGASEGMVAFNHKKNQAQYYRPDSMKTSGLRSSRVTDFAETTDGKILVSGEAGIDVLNPETGSWSMFDKSQNLPDDIVKLFITKEGVLWVADDDDVELVFSELRCH